MVVHNIGIRQRANVYYLYLENDVLIAQIAMPRDGQYTDDTSHLNAIAKELSIRYGVYKRKK